MAACTGCVVPMDPIMPTKVTDELAIFSVHSGSAERVRHRPVHAFSVVLFNHAVGKAGVLRAQNSTVDWSGNWAYYWIWYGDPCALERPF